MSSTDKVLAELEEVHPNFLEDFVSCIRSCFSSFNIGLTIFQVKCDQGVINGQDCIARYFGELREFVSYGALKTYRFSIICRENEVMCVEHFDKVTKSMYSEDLDKEKEEEERMARDSVVSKGRSTISDYQTYREWSASPNVEKYFNLKNEEKEMKIENVVMINNKRATEFTEEQLISAIEAEISKVDKLQGVLDKMDKKSKSMQVMIKDHLSNVETLTEILDSRS